MDEDHLSHSDILSKTTKYFLKTHCIADLFAIILRVCVINISINIQY